MYGTTTYEGLWSNIYRRVFTTIQNNIWLTLVYLPDFLDLVLNLLKLFNLIYIFVFSFLVNSVLVSSA